MVNARRVDLTQSSLHTSSSSWVPHFETLCSSRDRSLCSWNDGLCDIFQEQFHGHILLHALCCSVSHPSCLHIFCVQEGFSQCSLRKLRCACDPAAGLAACCGGCCWYCHSEALTRAIIPESASHRDALRKRELFWLLLSLTQTSRGHRIAAHYWSDAFGVFF